ncbi:hypothetical protein B0H11DRAFT_1908234 [Mycena galericulata]|nr:hypothetical protein B0H11DRAFT_1908234 [Mycena galericulata]
MLHICIQIRIEPCPGHGKSHSAGPIRGQNTRSICQGTITVEKKLRREYAHGGDPRTTALVIFSRTNFWGLGVLRAGASEHKEISDTHRSAVYEMTLPARNCMVHLENSRGEAERKTHPERMRSDLGDKWDVIIEPRYVCWSRIRNVNMKPPDCLYWEHGVDAFEMRRTQHTGSAAHPIHLRHFAIIGGTLVPSAAHHMRHLPHTDRIIGTPARASLAEETRTRVNYITRDENDGINLQDKANLYASHTATVFIRKYGREKIGLVRLRIRENLEHLAAPLL